MTREDPYVTASCFYFAYGSNMSRRRMEARNMSFDRMLSGRLLDHALAFNKRSLSYGGAGAANVLPRDGAVVEGVLYRLTSEEGIRIMDPFEGYPKGYRRELLPIQTEAGVCPAWVYLANPDYIDDSLQPACEYLGYVLEGRPYLSDAYYEALRAVPCIS